MITHYKQKVARSHVYLKLDIIFICLTDRAKSYSTLSKVALIQVNVEALCSESFVMNFY